MGRKNLIFIEYHTCLNKKNYQGVYKNGKLYCWTCWQNLLQIKKSVLRPKIISMCKNCKIRSRVSRSTKLCFLCDTLGCIY